MNHPVPHNSVTLPTPAATQQVHNSPKGELAIYGAGGTGINIVRAFESLRSSDDESIAIIRPYYLDTSVSNMYAEGGMAIPKASCVNFEEAINPAGSKKEVDGSGGLRAVNHDLIRSLTPEKVRNILPAYAAVIVTSGGGGTGSLIAPYLLKEVLKKVDLVWVYIVGDKTTERRLKNTIDTIHSMEGIARSSGKTVVIGYFANTQDTPRSVVDEMIRKEISMLSLLVSRRNAEMDTMDLSNHLQAHVIRKDEPHIARFYVRTGVVNEGDLVKGTLTSATLTTSSDDSGLRARVAHGCMGILPPNIAPNIAAMNHIHFFVNPTGMDEVLADLQNDKAIDADAEVKHARPDLLKNVNTTEDGVVVD